MDCIRKREYLYERNARLKLEQDELERKRLEEEKTFNLHEERLKLLGRLLRKERIKLELLEMLLELERNRFKNS